MITFVKRERAGETCHFPHDTIIVIIGLNYKPFCLNWNITKCWNGEGGDYLTPWARHFPVRRRILLCSTCSCQVGARWHALLFYLVTARRPPLGPVPKLFFLYMFPSSQSYQIFFFYVFTKYFPFYRWETIWVWSWRMRPKICQFQWQKKAHACSHHWQTLLLQSSGLWQVLHPSLFTEKTPQDPWQGCFGHEWLRQWWFWSCVSRQ